MHNQDTITSPKAESMGSKQKISERQRRDWTTVTTLSNAGSGCQSRSYMPASFWDRDTAKGISQVLHPRGAAPKFQG